MLWKKILIFPRIIVFVNGAFPENSHRENVTI